MECTFIEQSPFHTKQFNHAKRRSVGQMYEGRRTIFHLDSIGQMSDKWSIGRLQRKFVVVYQLFDR